MSDDSRSFEFLVRATAGDNQRFVGNVQMNTDLFARSLTSVPGDVAEGVLNELALTQDDASAFPDNFPIARTHVVEDEWEVTALEPPAEEGYARRVYDRLQAGDSATEALDNAASDWAVEEGVFQYADQQFESGSRVQFPLPRRTSDQPTVSGMGRVVCELTIPEDDDRIQFAPVEEEDVLVDGVLVSPDQFATLLDAAHVIPVDDT